MDNNILQEINKLDAKIAEQSAVIRHANNKYIFSIIERYAVALFISLIFVVADVRIWVILVIGIILFSRTATIIKNSRDVLQVEEEKLIQLQTERNNLWTKFIAG